MKITLNQISLEFSNESEFAFLIEKALPKLREIATPAKLPVSHLANANPNGEDGENVKAYLSATGLQRFKITQAEKDAGMTREQAARARLDAMESGEVATVQNVETVEDDGADLA